MLTRNCVIALVLAPVCLGSAAGAKPIVEFDAPNAAQQPFSGTTVTGMDDKGDVAGYFFDTSGNQRGFMRAPDGSFVIYGTTSTVTQGLDSQRQATGYFLNGSSNSGFVADASGTMTPFDVPGAAATFGVAIDSANGVAGYFQDSNMTAHGFRRDKRGKIKTFDVSGSGTGSGQGTFSRAISSDGAICGYSIEFDGSQDAFVRAADGQITTIGVRGVPDTGMLAINGSETAVGYYRSTDGVYFGLMHVPNGTLYQIDDRKGGTSSGQGTILKAINDNGVVAGQFVDPANVVHSFVSGMDRRINPFSPPDAGTGAGQGSYPAAINKRGAVAGTYIDSDNVSHGYIRP